MRKPLALLTGAAAVASTFALAAPASASHLCEHTVTVGGQTIAVDDPTQGATGVAYVCLEGIVTCEFGGGVHITIVSLNPINVTANPVLYPPCQPHP